MKIYLREDKVLIDGYVNAVERKSKPLWSRWIGQFVERICAGAFSRALARAEDVRILLNHDESRDLGGIKDGNLELEEDNIGLHARAEITDPETIKDAREGNLVGWSFGFDDVPDGVELTRDDESGLPYRKVKDLTLFEVSLLNRKKTPAYTGTLVNVREDGKAVMYSEETEDDIEIIDETTKEALEEIREETTPQAVEAKTEPEIKTEPETKEVSSDYYARYRNIIAEMKKSIGKI